MGTINFEGTSLRAALDIGETDQLMVRSVDSLKLRATLFTGVTITSRTASHCESMFPFSFVIVGFPGGGGRGGQLQVSYLMNLIH